jgi:hypothetical protein
MTELIINDTDYDGSRFIEIITADFEWLDTASPYPGYSRAGGFEWEWDPSERAKGGTMASGGYFFDEAVDVEDEEALQAALNKAKADLESRGYDVGFF